MPELCPNQILGADQRDLTPIGQPPKPAPARVAIIGESRVNKCQGLITGAHRRACLVGDENRRQSSLPTASATQPMLKPQYPMRQTSHRVLTLDKSKKVAINRLSRDASRTSAPR
ncbi:hypothetical protein Thiosp_02895 [Thiorhodovibrio litoralis]|nr:hypothetical protein Thiosp_02895 [Thiorhodovibrio litoralis]